MRQTHLLDPPTERIIPGSTGAIHRVSKRAFDIVVATLLLVLVSPVMLVVALLIKLDSPGPIFFKQERLGMWGRPFTFMKFRTMQNNSAPDIHRQYVQSFIKSEETEEDPQKGADDKTKSDIHKLTNDPRITRVGRVLRKTSLDELPQLINVLKGQMSLVGPRPPLPYEVQVYQDWHRARLAAMPGITGLWQVQGRSRVSFDDMVRMDLEYMTHQTLWLDIKILVLTIPAVMSGAGAR